MSTKYFLASVALAVLIKGALETTFSWPAALCLALILTLIAAGDVYVASEKLKTVRIKLRSVEADISSATDLLTKQAAEMRALQADFLEVRKISEESKKLISGSNLSMAFRPPERRLKDMK